MKTNRKLIRQCELNNHEQNDGIETIAMRCLLKAEACRWNKERLRLQTSGADHSTEIAPIDRDIINRAMKLPDCYMWMCRPTTPIPIDVSSLDRLAECYDALASILTAFAKSKFRPNDRHVDAEMLRLAAEAQSMLRRAVSELFDLEDNDQVEAFNWIRSLAADRAFFLDRFFTKDELADPAGSEDLFNRITEVAVQAERLNTQFRRQQRGITKLRYQIEQATSDEGAGRWDSVAETIQQLIDDGTPPSNPRIRELLLPHIEIIPKSPLRRSAFETVLHQIAEFRLLSEDAEPEIDSKQESQLVEDAARLVQKRSVLFVGGNPKAEHQHSLENALRVSQVIWVHSRHGEPMSSFEPVVARKDVALVILAIRWSSHSFTDLRLLCRKYGKPLVRLPAGYNANQVALQIMNQASTRLQRKNQTPLAKKPKLERTE